MHTYFLKLFSAFFGIVIFSPFTQIPDVVHFLYLIICPPFAFLYGLLILITVHQKNEVCNQKDGTIDFETYCNMLWKRNETHLCCPG